MDDYNVVVNVSDDPYESLETSITKVRPYSSTCCIYRVLWENNPITQYWKLFSEGLSVEGRRRR